MIAKKIKTETVAEALLLETFAQAWPDGLQRDVALELAAEVIGWRREAGQRSLQPIHDAKQGAPASQEHILGRISALHVRMVLEHGVEAGVFQRGFEPDTYEMA